MKALDAVLLGIGILIALTAQTSTAARKGKKPKNVFFSGIETPGEMINPGSTENDQGKAIIRGMIQRARDITSDDRVNGELTIEANACLDLRTHEGTLWGTFILENPGGKWLAGWIGQVTARGTTIYAMGYGVGAYKDFMANWTYTRIGSDPQIHFNLQGFIVRTIPTEAGLMKPRPGNLDQNECAPIND